MIGVKSEPLQFFLLIGFHHTGGYFVVNICSQNMIGAQKQEMKYYYLFPILLA